MIEMIFKFLAQFSSVLLLAGIVFVIILIVYPIIKEKFPNIVNWLPKLTKDQATKATTVVDAASTRTNQVLDSIKVLMAEGLDQSKTKIIDYSAEIVKELINDSVKDVDNKE